MPAVECAPGGPNSHEGQRNLIDLGPALIVQIGFDAAWNYQTRQRPNLPAAAFPALIDTGATESCIDDAHAQALGLSIADVQKISGVHGVFPVNMYLAHVYVPNFDYTVWGLFAGVNLAGGPHKALLGRTFLSNFVMIYDGYRAQVTLCR